MSPTRTDIDVRDIPSLKRIADTVCCVRVAIPGDVTSQFQVVVHTTPEEYITPDIHKYAPINTDAQPGQLASPTQSQQDAMEQEPVFREPEQRPPSSYECKGVHILVHYVKHYVPPTHARLQCTLYYGESIVKQDDQKQCNWSSKPVDSTNVLLTKIGEQGPLNQGMSITQTGIARGEILGVEDDVTWMKDLYRMQRDSSDIHSLFLLI